ncbi:MAG: acetyl-CoA carboxylase biotin carboxyl carrier protein [Chloroflexaceae bacterium]|jgi:acetyl-CoA carboxylase biotin carboxyl carrier protein|nr:acetyl-CoA carboxylase biotin carboxyl carrier protein [Chloroflexaceae bacterium]
MSEPTSGKLASTTDEFGLDAVREMLRLIAQSDVSEILIERGDNKLHIKRGVAPVVLPASYGPVPPLHHSATPPPQPMFAPAPPLPDEAPPEMPAGHTITAPMVGTFYAAPSPKDPPFVREGDEVRSGDRVGIIEAMKMMNEIESEVNGRVARVLVKNGQPVEYGQPLMVIEPM